MLGTGCGGLVGTGKPGWATTAHHCAGCMPHSPLMLAGPILHCMENMGCHKGSASSLVLFPSCPQSTRWLQVYSHVMTVGTRVSEKGKMLVQGPLAVVPQSQSLKQPCKARP